MICLYVMMDVEDNKYRYHDVVLSLVLDSIFYLQPCAMVFVDTQFYNTICSIPF